MTIHKFYDLTRISVDDFVQEMADTITELTLINKRHEQVNKMRFMCEDTINEIKEQSRGERI